MAVLTEYIGTKRGRIGNIIVQGWKELIVARSYFTQYNYKNTPAQQHYTSRFSFLMAEFKAHKQLIATLYPLHSPFHLLQNQWVSEQTPNTEFVGNQWQFISNPYTIMLTPTANKNEITLSTPFGNDYTTITLSHANPPEHKFQLTPIYCGLFLENGTLLGGMYLHSLGNNNLGLFKIPYLGALASVNYYIQIWQVDNTDYSLINYWCAEVLNNTVQ